MKWITNAPGKIRSLSEAGLGKGQMAGMPKKSKVYTGKELLNQGWIGVYEPWLSYIVRRIFKK